MKISDYFVNPSIWGIGLAFVFGLIWLAPLAPRKLNRIPPWLIFILGAILFVPCIHWIQSPLQSWVLNLLIDWLGQDDVMNHIFLTAVPLILFTGFVQEGAKLVPVVLYWLNNGRSISPKLGLTMGAMAGAGFGIFEAQWINNLIFSSGWTLQAAQSAGILGFLGLWERLFTVGLHISLGALTGWGLARGWGWQVYLAAALIHSLTNYGVILVQTGKITPLEIEIILDIITIILFSVVLWLRWRKSDRVEESENDINVY